MSLRPRLHRGPPVLAPLLLLVIPTLAWAVDYPPGPISQSEGKNECTPGWLPILFGFFLLFACWMTNCTLLGGVFQVMAYPGVVRVTYYYVGSQTVAALIYATLNLPPSLLILLFGTTSMKSYLGIFCFFSTYLDTLFCNLALLHSFCSGLDSYLRLNRQSRNLESINSKHGRNGMIWLKISSPWFIAAFLAIAQFAISDRNLAHLNEDCQRQFRPTLTNQLEATCVVIDSNFLILRTSVAYALPLIGCLILTGLQVRCLRRLRCIPSEFSSESCNNLPIQRDVTLETLAPLTEVVKPGCNGVPKAVYECPRHGRITYHQETMTSDDFQSLDKEQDTSIDMSTAIHMNQWLRTYHEEQLAVAINMVSCIVAVGVWSPLILVSLAYGLCHTPENGLSVKQPLHPIPGIDLSKYRHTRCFIQVAASRLADFRWWVYASTGLILPVALLLMDKDLRKACWRSLSLKAPRTVERKTLPLCEVATQDDANTANPCTSNAIYW